MREYSDKIHTCGFGLWSELVKEVTCVGYSVPYVNEESDFGELRVYFDTKTWNVETDGLIYTDPAFLSAIRVAFGTDDIHYSEQGMQGTNFVSFDVGQEFLTMYGEGCLS
jgi:hypothetical protein